MRNVICVLFVSLFAASAAFAQATRVWVSGLGDDNNPCSRTAPCKTFSGAISKVADGGEIDALDSAGYGAVTISKSVTIDGGGTLASILNTAVAGVIINAPSSAAVTLRNLAINGAGTPAGWAGVRILGAGRVILENVAIANQTGGSGLGIEVAAPSTLSLSNCSITSAYGAGIYSQPGSGTAKISVDHSRFDSDATAIFLAANTKAAVFASSLTHNGLGVYIADGTSTAHVHASTVSENQMAVNVAGPVTFYGSQVFANDLAFVVNAGGEVRTHGNNAIVGNTDPGATPVMVGLQ